VAVRTLGIWGERKPAAGRRPPLELVAADTVTDASGAVLPGVTVTVSGTGRQQPMVSVPAASDASQFPMVPIGPYTVTFKLASSKKAARANVQIVTNFNAEFN